MGRRPPAQHGARPARTNGRQVTGFDAVRFVPHEVNAAVRPDEGTEDEPMVDLILADARGHELRARHDPVRAAGESGDPPLRCVT